MSATFVICSGLVTHCSCASFHSICSRYRFKACNIFSELQLKFCIALCINYCRCNTDIVTCCKVSCICNATGYINLFVQLHIRCSTHIAFEFKAIVQCCYFLSSTIWFFVYDTSCSCASRTVYTRFTITCNRKVRCYTIFTVNANFAIFTICTSSRYSFNFKIFVHLNVNCCVTSCILFDECFDVFTAVVCISFCAFALYCHSGTKFISLSTTYVSIEFQTFVNQRIGAVFDFVS